jgi:uncharacterized protein YjbJ (UPF0337 family)
MANKHRVKGKVNEATGSLQKNLGKATDDREMQMKGQTKEMKGKAENAWGKLGDLAEDTKETIKDSARGDGADRPTK